MLGNFSCISKVQLKLKLDSTNVAYRIKQTKTQQKQVNLEFNVAGV